MLIDMTLQVTPQMVTDAQGNEKKSLSGHLGTHFDVMNKEFPLEYTQRPAVMFDVRHVVGRDIEAEDICLPQVGAGMFVAFYTGFIEQVGYGGAMYFKEHPQLSDELIACLLKKQIAIIGIDFAGVRRGIEHTPKDQYCADRGVFIVENLCNLAQVLENSANGFFTANTYPLRYAEMTGLPCRVVARID